MWLNSPDLHVIIEKKLTGWWIKSGCSIYLWAHRLDPPNPSKNLMAVIPGVGFKENIQEVYTEVNNFTDAVAKLRSLPEDKKNIFYTWDYRLGTIVSYSRGGTSWTEQNKLFTFFWGEHVDPN